jgi:hypothetical protein
MRAGSEAIPAEALKAERREMSNAEALAKFDFATSNTNEPVRTYDPARAYATDNTNARASAPAGNLDLNQAKSDATDEFRQIRSAQSENTASTTLRGGAEESALTPSHSTEATSYTSEKSVELARNQSDFQAMRNRAASTPIQEASSQLSPSFSMGSASAASDESNKVDVHATVLSNGSADESCPSDRKAISKTMGRRRSRLKLGLAFWKRNRSEKNVGDEDRPESQGS